MKSPCVMDNWTFKTDQLMNNPNYLARDTPNKQPWVACLVYLGGTCLAGLGGTCLAYLGGTCLVNWSLQNLGHKFT